MQLKSRFYLWASKCLRGALAAPHYTVYTSSPGHVNMTLSSLLYDEFRLSNRSTLDRDPGRHETHCKHNSLVSPIVTNNSSSCSYMNVCVLRCTLGHILRYMCQTSNNNKLLINNSLSCFATQVVYTWITVKWGIGYIDEGFLIWIIPMTYFSHEAVNWARTIGFACILFYSVLSVL